MALARDEFTRRLRRFREDAGLSQTEAARRVGVSERNYHRWEVGESTPHPKNIKRLAETFGQPTEVFLEPFEKGDQLDRVEDRVTTLNGAVKRLTVDLEGVLAVRDLIEQNNRLLHQLTTAVADLAATPARIEELAGDIAYLRHLAGETAQPAASQAGSSSRETQRSAHHRAS